MCKSQRSPSLDIAIEQRVHLDSILLLKVELFHHRRLSLTLAKLAVYMQRLYWAIACIQLRSLNVPKGDTTLLHSCVLK